MSRVERTDTPTDRRGSEHLRQAQRGRVQQPAPRSERAGRDKPGKAEGDLRDVEEALENRKE